MEGKAESVFPDRPLNSKQENFVNLQYCCTLCSTPLELHFEFDAESETVVEEASCPQCGIQTRKKSHPVN